MTNSTANANPIAPGEIGDTTANAKVLERIRRVMEVANDERGNPAVREQAQKSLQMLLDKYAVDEWMLSQNNAASGIKPSSTEDMFVCKAGNPVADELTDLVNRIARPMNVSVVFKGLTYIGKDYLENEDVTVVAVGFPSDLRVFQMAFTMLTLQMAQEITPTVDYSDTFDANVYRFHRAGWTWPQITEKMNEDGDSRPEAWGLVNARDGRLKRAAQREYKRREETYVPKQNPNAYRKSFAKAYVATVAKRMNDSIARERTNGTEVALRSKFDKVREMFLELFPDTFHHNTEDKNKHDQAGWEAGTAAGKAANLHNNGQMAPNATPAIG